MNAPARSDHSLILMRCSSAVILSLAFLAPPALAEDATAARPLVLREVLARVLRESPELAAQNWEIRAAEARILQAGLRPNPELSLEAENFTGSGAYKNGEEAERTLRLSQLVELGGKREARVAEATAGRAVSEWEYQVKRVEVLKAATTAFIDLLAAQRAVALAEETAALNEKITTVTEQRVAVGAANAVEVSRSNVAVASAKIELEQARRTLATARGNLAARWGGRSADVTAVSGDLDRLPEVPSLDALSARLMANPQLAIWTAERGKRQAAVATAQAQGRPDMTFQVGPRMEGNAHDATGVAGVSIPLPLWNRNQGTIAEAKANASKVEDERKAAEAKAFAELNEAWQTLGRAKTEAEMLARDVLPAAQQAEQFLSNGYAAGRFTQLEILDARRTLITSRNQHLRALADYHKALAEIDALTAAPVKFPHLPVQRATLPPKAARSK